MRGAMSRGVLLVLGFAAFAMMMALSAPVLSAEEADGKVIGPTMEIKKDNADRSSVGLRDTLAVPELTKDFEHPMGVPDQRSEATMPDRKPLCGPWSNAINHYACPPGYDFF